MSFILGTRCRGGVVVFVDDVVFDVDLLLDCISHELHSGTRCRGGVVVVVDDVVFDVDLLLDCISHELHSGHTMSWWCCCCC